MLTKRELTKAIQRYARRYGFSASTVRTVTTLRREAIDEYNERTTPTPRVAQTSIIKRDDEYIVRAFSETGQRLPSADYFTNDLDDAKATANMMCQQ